MKKIMFKILALTFLVSTVAFAGSLEAVSKRLRDSSGNRITQLAISAGATVYTEAIPVDDNVGYLSILVAEDVSGGLGDVAISAEYSNDETNFYTVYTTSSGTLIAEAAVVSSLSNETRWIQHTARLAKFVRYKIVATTASQLTFDVLWQRTH